ncbi:MAG: DUF4395 domain-containing protein, partial [Gemmatimonadetes bacterium]|nr:DUF4395 domain-containing protein [Gemmatimonadota bacterium]
MAALNRFFSFPHPVNEVSSRFVAAGVVVMAALAIGLGLSWLTAVLAAGFLARVLAGPRLSPLALFVTRVLVPALGSPERLIAGPPKRFAQAIGFVFATAAAVLWLGFGLSVAAYGVLGALIVAAFLEAAFALCLGCRVFNLLMRTGLIPESVCEDCRDWEARARG